MQRLAVEQRLLRGWSVEITIETPLPVQDSDLEQHAIVAVGLLQMKPALLLGAAVGTEDGLPCESLGARQRMHIDEQRVILAIEFHCLANRRINHAGIAFDRRTMTADLIDPIEGPHHRRLLEMRRSCRDDDNGGT